MVERPDSSLPQSDSIRATIGRFDGAARAAAAAAVPDGPDLVTLLAVIDRIPLHLQLARPELVTDKARARIGAELTIIDQELNRYLADGDPVHLAHALGPQLQNLYRVIRHCIGYFQLGRDPSRPVKIEALGLRAASRDPGGRQGLQILVHGQDLLAEVGGHHYVGFPPADLLGPDLPLLPAQPARHVPLYVEIGGPVAGCISALIHGWGDNVAWSDFRRFERVCRPASQPDPDDGEPVGLPDNVFDGGQYRAEVRRARAAWAAGS